MTEDGVPHTVADLDEWEKMRCRECGSSRIAHDRNGPSFCLSCNCTMEVQA